MHLHGTLQTPYVHPDSEVTSLSRPLYSARVSHTIVEQQLKTRAIPYASIFPSQTWDCAQGGGQRNRAVPVLRILARDLWPNSAGRAEEEGVCQNVKMSVMNWWNERPPQVTCTLSSLY